MGIKKRELVIFWTKIKKKSWGTKKKYGDHKILRKVQRIPLTIK